MDRFTTNISPQKARHVIVHALVLATTIVITIFLVDNNYAHQGLELISGFGLIFAAFLAGMLFTSIFTTPLAVASLLILGQRHPPLLVAALGACGSVLGDALLLKIIRQDVLSDLEVFTKPFTSPKLQHLFRSKLMFFPLTILAAIILASPLPDELALALFSAIKLKTHYFYILSYILNFAGILLLVSLGALHLF